MKTIPYLVEQHLLAEELQGAGVDTIAVNMAALILSPGVEFIIGLGGLARWFNWSGAIIPVLGRDEDFIQNRIQANQQGVLIKDAQGNSVQVTPARWVLWQYQMGLGEVVSFTVPIHCLSRNKQKIVALQQVQWQCAQNEVCKAHQLQWQDTGSINVNDQAVQLALQGRALVGDQTLDCLDDQFHHDITPLDPACQCRACQHYSKAYLHQMFKHHEAYGVRLLLEHNIRAI